MKNVNFFFQREFDMEKRPREIDDLGIETASGEDCSKGFRSDNYFCANQFMGIARGNAYWYDGAFTFSFGTDSKDAKVKKEYLDGLFGNKKEGLRLIDCVSSNLGMMKEFKQCYDWHYRSEGECKNSEDIRRSLTPANLKSKWKDQAMNLREQNKKDVSEIKELEKTGYLKSLVKEGTEPEKWNDEKMQSWIDGNRDSIKKKKRDIKELGRMIDNKDAMEKIWNDVKKNSVDRGFFFTNINVVKSDFGGTKLDVKGTILAPIHEFLPREMVQVRKMVSEALYVCVPDDAKVGKKARNLDFF